MGAASPLLPEATLAGPALLDAAVARTQGLPGLSVGRDDQGRAVELPDGFLRDGPAFFRTGFGTLPLGGIVPADRKEGRALRAGQGTAGATPDGAGPVPRDAAVDAAAQSPSAIEASLRARGARAGRGDWTKTCCACGFAQD